MPKASEKAKTMNKSKKQKKSAGNKKPIVRKKKTNNKIPQSILINQDKTSTQLSVIDSQMPQTFENIQQLSVSQHNSTSSDSLLIPIVNKQQDDIHEETNLSSQQYSIYYQLGPGLYSTQQQQPLNTQEVQLHQWENLATSSSQNYTRIKHISPPLPETIDLSSLTTDNGVNVKKNANEEKNDDSNSDSDDTTISSSNEEDDSEYTKKRNVSYEVDPLPDQQDDKINDDNADKQIIIQMPKCKKISLYTSEFYRPNLDSQNKLYELLLSWNLEFMYSKFIGKYIFKNHFI